MTFGWKTLGVQTRFMVIAAVGIVTLATATIALINWFEFAAVELKLRAFSENELNSLNSLVENAMEQRLEDPQNVAIKVFNGWFESRNAEYPGKLWSAWSPKVIAYMAATAPERAEKKPLDSIDEEALRTGRPIGHFVEGAYRFSLPIVLGKSSKASCGGCHADGMGLRDGEVIAVFSSSLSTANDFSALRQLLLLMAIGTLFGCLFVILESVREHYVGLQSLRSMSLMDARRKKASAFRLRHSQSLASLRHRPSQAKVLSTTHRFGKTTNALA